MTVRGTCDLDCPFLRVPRRTEPEGTRTRALGRSGFQEPAADIWGGSPKRAVPAQGGCWQVEDAGSPDAGLHTLSLTEVGVCCPDSARNGVGGEDTVMDMRPQCAPSGLGHE